jgi:predicted transcriptional regulator
MNCRETSAGEQLNVKSKRVRTQPTCMETVIKCLRRQRYTSALLVKEINLYSSSTVNSCLKKLRNAGLIGAVWDNRTASFVYYNIKL